MVYATTEGVVLNPSAFAITVGLPPSMTATLLFVVPSSIPTAIPSSMPSGETMARLQSIDRSDVR